MTNYGLETTTILIVDINLLGNTCIITFIQSSTFSPLSIDVSCIHTPTYMKAFIPWTVLKRNANLGLKYTRVDIRNIEPSMFLVIVFSMSYHLRFEQRVGFVGSGGGGVICIGPPIDPTSVTTVKHFNWDGTLRAWYRKCLHSSMFHDKLGQPSFSFILQYAVVLNFQLNCNSNLPGSSIYLLHHTER